MGALCLAQARERCECCLAGPTCSDLAPAMTKACTHAGSRGEAGVEEATSPSSARCHDDAHTPGLVGSELAFSVSSPAKPCSVNR